MPIRYYQDKSGQAIVSVKPWVVPMIKEMADADKVPQIKVITQCVEQAYERYKDDVRAF